MNILDSINSKGFYIYNSKEVSNENTKELEQLILEDKIESLQNDIIGSYIYVLKSNPRNVRWYSDDQIVWSLRYD